jgi:Helix-turn-helix domain
MASLPALRPGQRLSGNDREAVAADLLEQYRAGSSIRQICHRSGYSIGRVRRLLIGAGVEFRSRGGGASGTR